MSDAATPLPTSGDFAATCARAALAMDLSFTLCDARDDMPLVWVNPAFSRVTGYAFEEAVGRNCRFMQGPDTDPAAVLRIREALEQGRPVVQTLLNHRRDGTPFWNEVSISPISDADGRLVSFVGIQADVTVRTQLEQERAEHYRLERRAREVAERARARTALLADVSHAVTRVDARAAMAALTELLAGPWCGWAAAYLADGSDFSCVAVAGAELTTPRLIGHQFNRLHLPADLQHLLGSGTAVLVPAVDAASPWAVGSAGGLVVAPLRGRDQLLGVLLLGSPAAEAAGDAQPAGTSSDLSPVVDYLALVDAVATRVALTLDITRLYEREHELAQKLQQALLPQLPSVAGLELAGHYAPSTDAAKVGGDWYDVLPLPDGRVLVAIGDVEGHDLDAATTMGRLRAALQSYALELHEPAALVGLLQQALTAMALPRLATVCIGVLERPTAAGPGRLGWAAAGHPPPLLRRADGTVEVLDSAQGPMLGAPPVPRAQGETVFGVGDLLLMYTDGLVDDRRRPLRSGIAALAEQLAGADPTDLTGLWRPLVLASSRRVEDDAAFVAVRSSGVVA